MCEFINIVIRDEVEVILLISRLSENRLLMRLVNTRIWSLGRNMRPLRLYLGPLSK